jgi:hypothetical protein
MFEHDEKTIGKFIVKSGLCNEGCINTYKGCGGYGYYDKSDSDGYPIEYYSMLAGKSKYFHNFGSFFNISSITDGIAGSLSYVTSTGEIHNLTGSGEHTIAKIRYIRPSSRGYVYSCALNNQLDIRMIINGHNVRVLEGAPGIYEVCGSDVSSYTYQGIFSYVDVTGQVITTYCHPIYYCTPDEFGTTDDPSVIGVQVVCDSRAFDWYWDDIRSYIISEVGVTSVFVEGYLEPIEVGHMMSKCMQIPEKGKAVYINSSDDVVWLGNKIYKACSYSVYDTLWMMFMDSMCPPNRSINYPSALLDIVHARCGEVFVKPYLKSLSIFVNPEMKLFENTLDLRSFLQVRDRPYAFSSLVNTLVRRGIYVNYSTLIHRLKLGGIIVHNTTLVVVAGDFPTIDFLNLCSGESIDFINKSVKKIKNAWFRHHLDKKFSTNDIGVYLSSVRPMIPLSPIAVSGSRYMSFNARHRCNNLDLIYVDVGFPLYGRSSGCVIDPHVRVYFVSSSVMKESDFIDGELFSDVLYSNEFKFSIELIHNTRKYRVKSFGCVAWGCYSCLPYRWKYGYEVELIGDSCSDENQIKTKMKDSVVLEQAQCGVEHM